MLNKKNFEEICLLMNLSKIATNNCDEVLEEEQSVIENFNRIYNLLDCEAKIDNALVEDLHFSGVEHLLKSLNEKNGNRLRVSKRIKVQSNIDIEDIFKKVDLKVFDNVPNVSNLTLSGIAEQNENTGFALKSKKNTQKNIREYAKIRKDNNFNDENDTTFNCNFKRKNKQQTDFV